MAFSAIMTAVAVAGTAFSAYSSVEQGNAQRQQADYQAQMAQRNAAIAEQNAQLAEEEGREIRRDAHDAAQRKRLEAARLAAAERAKTGASGAQVDQGSALDLTLDMAERGELDAMRVTEAGARDQYNRQLKAWGLRQQGENMQSQADMHGLRAQGNSMAEVQAGLGLLGSSLKQGENFYTMMQKNSARL